MNKTALKSFATGARKELLKKVEARALKLGITIDSIKKADLESSDAIFIDGKQLSKEERIQRNKLIDRIKQIGFNQVIEEVAYTWFNRFTALRFMEVNDYLPTKVRVLSSTHADSAEPDMIKEALSLDLDLDKEYIYELKMNNNTAELFKYLIIKHCNDLNRYMPFMFETIDDYSEILFPEDLLAIGSCIRQMTNTEVFPEDNWHEVEIIGWLYQYYIAEEKDRVFKAKKKYKTEEIPFATQLFTPEWIVRYMVQNTLGRYWIESHPEHRDLLDNWEYYLENTNPEPDLEEKLAPYINKELKVEDIKCFDPAMGSGHILVYMFDVLYEIYSKCGYMEREIPKLIIENNLYGLDIDDRAYQLASFSVVMKALEYNRRFLRSIERNSLTLNLAAIQETNKLTDEDIAYIAGVDSGENFDKMKVFLEQFKDAKTIGSLIKVTLHDTPFLQERLKFIKSTPATDLFETEKRENILSLLPKLIKQTQIMGQNYDAMVTNPPYMGLRNMNAVLLNYVSANFPDSKGDLFATFMELDHYIKKNGFYASVNQHSWMFLSSFEKLREKVIKHKFIESMLHLGPRAFEEIGGEVVQSTAFVLRNRTIAHKKGIYVRLTDDRTAREKKEKAIEAVQNQDVLHRYSFEQDKFSAIPKSPIAYWVSENFVKMFMGVKIGDVAITKQGSTIGDNNTFLRLWHEIDLNKKDKWFFCLKGGPFRKWYGNHDYVINWENNGGAIKGTGRATIRSEKLLFKRGINWSNVFSGSSSFRIMEEGYFFESTSSVCFPEDKILYMLGLLNTKISEIVTKILNPTLHLQSGNVADMPYIYSESYGVEVESLVRENIRIVKCDWDSYETSWDFKTHPLLAFKSRNLESSFLSWTRKTESDFLFLKQNEEKLNEIFISLFNVQDEVTPEVEDKEISIRKGDLEKDVKSFISYAVGCSFGRYSLDTEGLVFAGGEFDTSRYETFAVDKDNIIPILPGSYFEDDIVSRFVDFVRVTFGGHTLSENLDFIANALGQKKGETVRETLRRYFLNDFYKDHLKTYKKRPIYWLFTSGKEKAFNCLVYMHRYDKTTLSRLRTDYLHDYQNRLDAEKKELLNIIEEDSTTKEVSNAKRELKMLNKKIDELKVYDELLHHMADMQIEIDLDNGVKVNYEKFKGLVAKI